MNKKVKIWKIIAITGFVLMTLVVVSDIYRLITVGNFFQPRKNVILLPGYVVIMNILSWGAFLYLCFKPLTFNLYMVFALYYAFGGLLEGGNIMPALYSLVALLCAYKGGFFRKHVKLKLIIFLILFTLCFLTQLRYGILTTFRSMVKISIVGMLTAASLLLLDDEIKNFIVAYNNKILKISQYPDLNERDKTYLKAVLKGAKYETIAKDNEISLGSLKNRMTEIYRIINVADKTELLIHYTDCE